MYTGFPGPQWVVFWGVYPKDSIFFILFLLGPTPHLAGNVGETVVPPHLPHRRATGKTLGFHRIGTEGVVGVAKMNESERLPRRPAREMPFQKIFKFPKIAAPPTPTTLFDRPGPDEIRVCDRFSGRNVEVANGGAAELPARSHLPNRPRQLRRDRVPDCPRVAAGGPLPENFGGAMVE